MYAQNFRERDDSAFLFPTEGRLLLAVCNPSQENTDPPAALELYDTSSTGEPGKLQCTFTLPSKSDSRNVVTVCSGDSYHYLPSTFYTRPEDRILTIFVSETLDPDEYHDQSPRHISSIVVFISTLLRLSDSSRFIAWEEWKQYAWVPEHQEAYHLFSLGTFISSSRFIHFLPDDQGTTALEVTTFRPSLVERQLYVPADTSDSGGPCSLVGRKALLDVEVAGDDDTEVMMTEDNIILMTVGSYPD